MMGAVSMTDQPLPLRLTRVAIQQLSHAPRWAVKLAAGRPVKVDGQSLDVDARLGLRIMNTAPGQPVEELDIETARRELELEAWIFGARPTVPLVQDRIIPGPDGTRLPIRVYDPAPGRAHRGVLVFAHGGGWTLGSIDMADPVCRFLARYSGVPIVSVGYRLAPENPFPAGLDDVVAAFRYVRDHARDFGVTVDELDTHIGIGGHSAGANLAAVAAHRTVEDEAGGPTWQLLLNPITDLSRKHASRTTFGSGYLLTDAELDWYRDHYLPAGVGADHPDISVLRKPWFRGLAPAHLLISGFDPLRDEGLAYAEALRAAAVPVHVEVVPGALHASIQAVGTSRQATTMLTTVAGWVREQLGTPEDQAVSDGPVPHAGSAARPAFTGAGPDPSSGATSGSATDGPTGGAADPAQPAARKP